MVRYLEDYDMSLSYHPRNANVVADSFSQTTMGNAPHVKESKKKLVKDVHRLAQLGVRLEYSPKGGFMVNHNSKSYLMVQVKYKQHLYPILMEYKESVLSKINESFS